MIINQQNFNDLETLYTDSYETILYHEKWNIIYLYGKELPNDFLSNNKEFKLLFSKSLFNEKKKDIDNSIKECIEESGNLGNVKSYVYEIIKEYKKEFVDVMEERNKYLSLSNTLTEDDYLIGCDKKRVSIYNQLVNKLNLFLSLHLRLKKDIEYIVSNTPNDLIENEREFILELKSIISIVKEPKKAAIKKYELITDYFDKFLKKFLEEGREEEFSFKEVIYDVLMSKLKTEIDLQIKSLDNKDKLPSIASIKVKSTIFKNNNYISILVKNCIEKIYNDDNVEIELEQDKTAKIYLTTIYKKIKYENLYEKTTQRKRRRTKEELLFVKGKFSDKLEYILDFIKELSSKKRDYKYFLGKYNNLKVSYYYNEDQFIFVDNKKQEVDITEEIKEKFFKDIVECCSKENNTYMKYEFMKEKPLSELLPRREIKNGIAKYIEIEDISEIDKTKNKPSLKPIKKDEVKEEKSTSTEDLNFNF